MVIIARKAGRRCRWQKKAARFFRSRAVGGPSRSRPGNGNCGKACGPPLPVAEEGGTVFPQPRRWRAVAKQARERQMRQGVRAAAAVLRRGGYQPPAVPPAPHLTPGEHSSPLRRLPCLRGGGPRQRWRGIPCKRADPIRPYDTGSSLPVGAAISRPRITSQVGPTGGDKPRPYAPLSALRATSPKGGSPQPPPPGALGVPSAHTGVATAHCRRRSLSPLCA